jgi:hypothetical protein
LLARLKQPAEAGRVLVEARRRALWEEREEVLGFEAWRGLGAPAEKAPAPWLAAHQTLNAKTDAALAAHLKAHPNDIHAARGALRSAGPLEEEAALRAALATAMARAHSGHAVEGDADLLKVRAARGLLAASPRAARHALGGVGAEAFLRLATERRLKTADANAALADLARIAHRAGDEAAGRAIAARLADRHAAAGKALRAELGPEPPKRPDAFRLVNGRPVPLRPRDLSWPLLANLLGAEGFR